MISPAITHQSKHYPPEWRGKVPARVRMLKDVRSDLPFSSAAVHSGEEYDVWVNSHGAVSVYYEPLKLLGVKPDEFTIIKWALTVESAADAIREMRPSEILTDKLDTLLRELVEAQRTSATGDNKDAFPQSRVSP